MIRTPLIYMLLLVVKSLSRLFYRHDWEWVGSYDQKPWKDIRLVAFLNHTSLYEPLFLGGVPNSFCWRLARHGVVPVASKTTSRPLVGMLFKFVANQVVPISRERDHTWFTTLQKIDPDSMVVILPEGRMKRANGLDLNGQPMSVRGGIADILEAIQHGKMLIAYSGGLHHVQIPGRAPRPFKRIRLRLEEVEIGAYMREMISRAGEENFKRTVREDLDRRRDLHCPEESR